MKSGISLCSALLFISFFSSNTFAQGEAALPFLNFPVSTMNAGMGSVGTSLPTDNVYGFLYNPAQLGYISQFSNFGFQFYLNKPEIMRDNFPYHPIGELNSFAFNLGYNFEKLLPFPLSIGIAYGRSEILYQYYYYNNYINDRDEYKTYSIGIGTDYFVQLSLGFTFRSITSNIGEAFAKTQNNSSGVNSYDVGLLINIPVIKLIKPGFTTKIFGGIPLIPSFNFSIGYAQSDIGDKVYYIDPSQSDPLPRTARLGYGISAGIKLPMDVYKIEIVHIDFSSEAEDYLIVLDSSGQMLSYQKLIGDIKIGKNILGIKGDDKVSSHKGLSLQLLESFELFWGRVSNQYILQKSRGFGFRFKGLFKFIADQEKNRLTNFIADHFDIKYYNTKNSLFSNFPTAYQGIELSFNNFIFN